MHFPPFADQTIRGGQKQVQGVTSVNVRSVMTPPRSTTSVYDLTTETRTHATVQVHLVVLNVVRR